MRPDQGLLCSEILFIDFYSSFRSFWNLAIFLTDLGDHSGRLSQASLSNQHSSAFLVNYESNGYERTLSAWWEWPGLFATVPLKLHVEAFGARLTGKNGLATDMKI